MVDGICDCDHCPLRHPQQGKPLEAKRINDTLQVTGRFQMIPMEQSGFRPEEETNYQGATYGWQQFFGGLERVVAGLD